MNTAVAGKAAIVMLTMGFSKQALTPVTEEQNAKKKIIKC